MSSIFGVRIIIIIMQKIKKGKGNKKKEKNKRNQAWHANNENILE